LIDRRKSKSKQAPLDELIISSEVEGVEGEGGARAITPMQRIEMRRRRTLEESWNSLDLFNRLQKGRISFDCENDTLDEYVLGERSNNQAVGGLAGAGDTSMGAIDENEEAGVFTIPELPSGRQVVINLYNLKLICSLLRFFLHT